MYDNQFRWALYFFITEEYDRTICTGIKHGESWPKDLYEQRLVNKFAISLLKKLQLKINDPVKKEISNLSKEGLLQTIMSPGKTKKLTEMYLG